MRLMEIASAEEQLALWKLVNDNVWAAINQQAREEAASKAAEQRSAKLKGGKRKTKGAAPSLRIPPPPPPKTALPPQQQQQKKAVGAQQPPSRVANPQQLSAQPIQPTAAAQPQTLLPKLQQSPKKVGFSAKNIAATKKW